MIYEEVKQYKKAIEGLQLLTTKVMDVDIYKEIARVFLVTF